MITIGDQSWFRDIQTNPPHYESALALGRLSDHDWREDQSIQEHGSLTQRQR